MQRLLKIEPSTKLEENQRTKNSHFTLRPAVSECKGYFLYRTGRFEKSLHKESLLQERNAMQRLLKIEPSTKLGKKTNRPRTLTSPCDPPFLPRNNNFLYRTGRFEKSLHKESFLQERNAMQRLLKIEPSTKLEENQPTKNSHFTLRMKNTS